MANDDALTRQLADVLRRGLAATPDPDRSALIESLTQVLPTVAGPRPGPRSDDQPRVARPTQPHVSESDTSGPEDKRGPQEVNYRPTHDQTKACGACRFYTETDPGAGACKLVLGRIKASWTCDLFQPRTEAPEEPEIVRESDEDDDG